MSVVLITTYTTENVRHIQKSEAQSSKPEEVDGGVVPLALSFVGGRITTCMVITHPGISPSSTRESARVLLFSKILPAFINLRSLIDFGPFCFSAQTQKSRCQIDLFKRKSATILKEFIWLILVGNEVVTFKHLSANGWEYSLWCWPL